MFRYLFFISSLLSLVFSTSSLKGAALSPSDVPVKTTMLIDYCEQNSGLHCWFESEFEAGMEPRIAFQMRVPRIFGMSIEGSNEQLYEYKKAFVQRKRHKWNPWNYIDPSNFQVVSKQQMKIFLLGSIDYDNETREVTITSLNFHDHAPFQAAFTEKGSLPVLVQGNEEQFVISATYENVDAKGSGEADPRSAQMMRLMKLKFESMYTFESVPDSFVIKDWMKKRPVLEAKISEIMSTISDLNSDLSRINSREKSIDRDILGYLMSDFDTKDSQAEDVKIFWVPITDDLDISDDEEDASEKRKGATLG